MSKQITLGYSYGSLLAAQTAMEYANKGNVINNLVLVGSPIDAEFLALLRANNNIDNVIVVDLTNVGDPIHAGMTDVDLLLGVPSLVNTVGTTQGHFYYSGENVEGSRRRADLAATLYSEGLR